jgi:hypothetical protein
MACLGETLRHLLLAVCNKMLMDEVVSHGTAPKIQFENAQIVRSKEGNIRLKGAALCNTRNRFFFF